MSIGRIKGIDNADRRFGSDLWYWFVKVQAKGRGERGEEYWLVTEGEAVRFAERGARNQGDDPELHRGVFKKVANTDRRFGEDTEYFGIKVAGKGKPPELWLLTAADLDGIRRRVEDNREDIEANKESWLADLLD
jgi:hypothetical protein